MRAPLIPALIALVLLVGCSGGNSAGGSGGSNAAADSMPKVDVADRTPKVEVTSVRVVSFTNDSGKTFPMVLVDWKNVGSTPVTVVNATITAQDASGNDLDYQAKDYCIFVASGKDAPIAPGQTYHEPEGEGHILLPSDGTAAKARIEITKVLDEPQD